MKRQELLTLLGIIELNWSTFKVNNNKEAIILWYECLKDIPFEIAKKAVIAIAYESEFPPVVATIRKKVNFILEGPTKIKLDAVTILNQAVRNYGQYQVEKAMQFIFEQDPVLHEVIKSIGFTAYCKSNQEFSNGLILKIYSEASEQRENLKLLPKEFCHEISEIRHNALLNGGAF